ncbi:MAG: iron-containing redox enzyme family protein [Pseudomonadota bacterium]
MNELADPRLAATPRSVIMRRKMELTNGDMHEAFATFWARDDLAEVFPAFLVLLHQIMRASVPLMRTAAVVARERADGDLLCRALAEYYEKHCDEEKDHDLWTLNDLEASGFDRAAVLDTLPPANVAKMVGPQYYWLHHFHPVMLLGYIAVLEGSPPSSEHIDEIAQRTGLPEEAFRTYRFHGEVDPHHLADLDRTIDTLPLGRREMGLIGVSAAFTAAELAKCVAAISPSDAPKRQQ